jgi:AraC-like DNA-binding protein
MTKPQSLHACHNVVRQVGTMDRMDFSTNTLPEHKRFSAYRDELAKRSCNLDLRVADESRFHADLEFRHAGTIGIMTNALTAIDTVRTPRLVRDGDDTLLVMLLLSGRAYQTQLGNDYALNAGDAIICDSGYPGEFNIVADSKLLTLKMPRMKLGALLPHASRFAGARLDKDPVARRLLSGYVAGTSGIDVSGNGHVARLYEDHIVELVALALGTEGEMRLVAEQRGAQAVRRAAVVREIEASANDPALNATTVAFRLGITVRYVHHLLEPTGRTFSEHALDSRLATAVAQLRDPRQAQRKIADIAFGVGFRDLSYFNRTFRRRYGVTPRDVRHARLATVAPPGSYRPAGRC